jgi:hypothetical protein
LASPTSAPTPARIRLGGADRLAELRVQFGGVVVDDRLDAGFGRNAGGGDHAPGRAYLDHHLAALLDPVHREVDRR